MPLLELKNVYYEYPRTNKIALDNINFSLSQGEYIAILGLNGSGKSTLARLIAGFFEPLKGEVIKQNGILPGIVFQQPKEQIVAGIVERDTAFGPQNLSMTESEIELRTIECLSVVSLVDKALSKTFELSLGQTQRLAFSGILALFPDLLILDEATAMLDPDSKNQLVEFVNAWNKKGHTVISVTHDLDEALAAKRIIVMDQGQVIFDGSPKEFKETKNIFESIFGIDGEYTSFKSLNSEKNKSAETSLKVQELSFSYGDFSVFKNISFELKKGTLVALTGPSGCGKSTLFECLAGLKKNQGGKIYALSRPVLGLQESEAALFEPYSADDVAFGPKNKNIKGKELFECVKKSMELAGLDYKKYGNLPIVSLSGGEKRKLSVAGLIALDSDILIFDEPTAVLTPQEIDELMKVTKNLSARGKSIIFISHKLKEIKQIADRCTVLRLGKCIGTVDVASTTMEEMSEMMVGRKLNLSIDKKPAHPGDAILSVHNLVVMDPVTGTKKVNNVSFEARAGEITCIAGIDNNGQSEMVLALAGMIESEGDISLDGERITGKGIRYRNTHGVSHIPEDRHKHGLVLDFNLDENMILQTYFTPEFSSHGFLRAKAIEGYAEEMIREYDIRCANGTLTNVRSMSGGNQQKIILAREISRAHDLLIAVQPTRGLDIGAARFIHEQLVKERDSGKAVLLVSLELDEVMEVSDRILVMHSGEIVADVRPKEVSIQELGLYMAGAKRSVSV